jgi:hypothetical protein
MYFFTGVLDIPRHLTAVRLVQARFLVIMLSFYIKSFNIGGC